MFKSPIEADDRGGYTVLGTAGNYADKTLQVSYYGDLLSLREANAPIHILGMLHDRFTEMLIRIYSKN